MINDDLIVIIWRLQRRVGMWIIWPFAICTSADLARLQGAFLIGSISIIVTIVEVDMMIYNCQHQHLCIIIIFASQLLIGWYDDRIKLLQSGTHWRCGCGLGWGLLHFLSLINYEHLCILSFSNLFLNIWKSVQINLYPIFLILEFWLPFAWP